jgi:hypothetical protein
MRPDRGGVSAARCAEREVMVRRCDGLRAFAGKVGNVTLSFSGLRIMFPDTSRP